MHVNDKCVRCTHIYFYTPCENNIYLCIIITIYLQVYWNLLFAPYFTRHNTFEVPFNTEYVKLQKMVNNGNVLGFVICIIKLIAIKMITLMTVQEINYLFFPLKHFSNYSIFTFYCTHVIFIMGSIAVFVPARLL